MEDELIQKETAILAKQKGFNISTLCYYPPHSTMAVKDDIESTSTASGIYPAPTQSLLQKWLREKHNFHITVDNNASGWYWILYTANSGTLIAEYEYRGPNYAGEWDTYELALENGLLTALNLIK